VIYEIIGWTGAALVLVAYAVVIKRGTSMPYHLLNIAGAVGLLANALHHRAFPSTAVNVVWIAIALWGMRISKSRRKTMRSTR
jgi:hypothetical protein